MAYTIPGPGGEVWWWEEEIARWRLVYKGERTPRSQRPPTPPDEGQPRVAGEAGGSRQPAPRPGVSSRTVKDGDGEVPSGG